MSNLKVALKYAEAGFRIFPCGIDKRPLVSSWATDQTSDAAQILIRWGERPEALVALPMKPHGLLVFDADRHHDGEDGVAHFRALCAEHEPLPAHPIVLTLTAANITFSNSRQSQSATANSAVASKRAALRMTTTAATL